MKFYFLEVITVSSTRLGGDDGGENSVWLCQSLWYEYLARASRYACAQGSVDGRRRYDSGDVTSEVWSLLDQI